MRYKAIVKKRKIEDDTAVTDDEMVNVAVVKSRVAIYGLDQLL
jgi:hypothetical protein